MRDVGLARCLEECRDVKIEEWRGGETVGERKPRRCVNGDSFTLKKLPLTGELDGV